MRSTLILITLAAALVSCGKKENNLGSSVAMSTFEQKDFLTIPHDENASLIRSKLLNLIVEQTFPAIVDHQENALKKNDELDKFEMSERDMRNYQEKEKGFAKIIVSYPDREEVYFLPERVPVANLVSELELSAGADRVIKMLPVDNDKTYKEAVIYLVSLNHADLMKNDQKFFSTQTNSMRGFTNQSIVIDSYKAVTLSIDYEFYMQKTAVQSISGKAIKCTRDLLEAGMCGPPCAYKKNIPSTEFERVNENRLEALGLSLKYANNFASVKDLNIVNKRDGHFEVKIESQEALGDNYALAVVQSASLTSQRNAAGYDYNNMCSSSEKNVSGEIILQSKVNFSVAMTTFGRGAELLRVKL